MRPGDAITAVLGLGVIALLLAFVAPSLPFLGTAGWLFLTVGVIYVTSAVVAWLLAGPRDVSIALTLLPALLAPLVALLAFAGGDVGRALTLAGQLPILSFLAVVFGIGLAFPLGLASRPRRQWAIVVVLVIAAVPLVLTALSALSPGPPEDRDLLVLIGMVVLTVAPLPAIPTYALGRSLRQRVGSGGRPSPYASLAAAAVPFLLVLAGNLAAPYFVGETIFGVWILLVPMAAVVAIFVQVLRIRARTE